MSDKGFTSANPWGATGFAPPSSHGDYYSNASTMIHEPHTHESVRASLIDVGIFRDTILPSVAVHSSLALAAFVAGRATNRLDTKEMVWPVAPVANAWWSAVG
jgi:hypothetical protein